MIADDAMKQAVYQYLLKVTYRRLEQTIPGSSEGAFAHLSLAAVLNLLFLLRGEWGSLGDYVTTQRALRALVGDDLLWAEPQKAAPPPLRWLTSFVQRDSICTRTTGCRDTIRQEKPLLAGKAVWSHLEEGMIDDLITTLEIVRDEFG